MRVALVHDWLNGMRGGEKCLEVFCELFPEADIWTLLHKPGAVSSTIESHRIFTSFLQRLPFIQNRYRLFLPLFPTAVEQFSLKGYDVVLSSSHCVAKGIVPPPDALHVCYCFTPMRYVWDMYHDYFGKGRRGRLSGALVSLFSHYLRLWDAVSSRRVDRFVAISKHVARRIRRYYGRESEVIHPPVDTEFFTPEGGSGDFYLMITAFAPYKRVDLAIRALRSLGRPLRIIGSGQDEKRLRAMAGPDVTFLGWQSDEVLRENYSACRALIFPGEEDFGIVPLEVQACGRPVIAYGRGGALETVVPLGPEGRSPEAPGEGVAHGQEGPTDSPTGVFFNDQTEESLIEAVRLFETYEDRFELEAARANALRFDRGRFKERISDYLERAVATWRGGSEGGEGTGPC